MRTTWMDWTLPDPSLRGVMAVAAAAQTAGIEWQGRRLVDVQADLDTLTTTKETP